MGAPKQIRLGDLLIADNVITENQLEAALKNQKTTGHKLGKQLVADGCLSIKQLNSFLARQLNIPYIDIDTLDIKSDVVKLIPELTARRCRVIALGAGRDGQMVVGMADPTNIFNYDEISKVLGGAFRSAVVDEEQVLETIEKVFRKTAAMGGIAAELEIEAFEEEKRKEEDSLQVDEAVEDAPVVRFLQTMFEDALAVNASDVHIEPNEKHLMIRLRLDGVLHEQVKADRRVALPLISKLKLMAGLDISEKRLPQDGRFQLTVTGKKIDVRLSTLPVQGGRETAVMRILNQSNSLLDLDTSGMPPDILKRFRQLSHSPNGVLLVTGPTGSGKTTTLYGALSELNSSEVKILTAEDPVEYRLPGISQVQINPKIGLDFGNVLRAFMRQDPDIILVGEMRDQETVETAMRAAMTGHLVMSTIHTNSAVSTPLRILDMGIEPFLIAAALKGVLAQRLVRKICDRCVEPYEITTQEFELLAVKIGKERVERINFKHGRGCNHCNSSGYSGRIGIYELLEMDGELARHLNDGNLSGFAQAAVRKPGYKSLWISALEQAARGLTTLEQVLKIAYGADE